MTSRLKEWAIGHLRHKDIFHKKLKDIEDTESGFIAHFKDKDEHYIIQETLDFNDIPKDNHVSFVTLNTQKNFSKLLSEWKILISFPNLRIIFVEKISNGRHWTVSPYIHDKISDKSSLKSGLKTLFDNAKNE